MRLTRHVPITRYACLAAGLAAALPLLGRQSSPAPDTAPAFGHPSSFEAGNSLAQASPGDLPPPKNLTAEEDHQNMMDQLGIKALRAGPSGDGPVFRLLGAKDLGVGDDYRAAQMPPVNEGLLDGQLAWRQHDGGHTDGPNWKYFIAWADKFFGRAPAKLSQRAGRFPREGRKFAEKQPSPCGSPCEGRRLNDACRGGL